jgi:hypothetical protein
VVITARQHHRQSAVGMMGENANANVTKEEAGTKGEAQTMEVAERLRVRTKIPILTP